MATLSVPTATSTSIAIQTSDYASGHGNLYVFYSGAYASGHTNRLGEAGLGQWYHGRAGYVARASATDNADATQAGAGWDNGNFDGGMFSFDIEPGVACSGSGAGFGVADSANTVLQTVQLRGATGSSMVPKYWSIWANGIHAVAAKYLSGSALAAETGVRGAYVSTTRVGTQSIPGWGFAGANIGVLGALAGAASAAPIPYTGTNDNSPFTLIYTSMNTVAAGTVFLGRLALDGYEGTGVVTVALAEAFQADLTLHSGTNLTLTVSVGTKVTSGTDRFGTTGTTWTDGFDPQRSAWILAAAANKVTVGGGTAASWAINGSTVTRRFRPCFILTGWTGGSSPIVTLGGTAQALGTDYECYADVSGQTLYFCLLKDIMGTEGALAISAPSTLVRRPLSRRTGSRAARAA